MRGGDDCDGGMGGMSLFDREREVGLTKMRCFLGLRGRKEEHKIGHCLTSFMKWKVMQ